MEATEEELLENNVNENTEDVQETEEIQYTNDEISFADIHSDLGIITCFLIFFTIVIILKYIYKFFNMIFISYFITFWLIIQMILTKIKERIVSLLHHD